MRAVLDAELRAAGKDPRSFPVAAYHSINVGPDAEECLAEARRFFAHYYGEGGFSREGAQAMTATGTVEEWAAHPPAVRDEGATPIASPLAPRHPPEPLPLLTRH